MLSVIKCSETEVWSSSVQEPFHPSPSDSLRQFVKSHTANAGKNLVYKHLSWKSRKYQHDHVSGKKTVVAWGSHSIGLWFISRCVYLKMNWRKNYNNVKDYPKTHQLNMFLTNEQKSMILWFMIPNSLLKSIIIDWSNFPLLHMHATVVTLLCSTSM